MTLTSTRITRQAFCKMSLDLGLVDVFLVIGLECEFLERRPQRREVFLITSCRGAQDINMTLSWMLPFLTWWRGVFARFLHCIKLPFFPFYTLLLEARSLTHPGEGEAIKLHILEWGVASSTYVIWNSSVKKVVSSLAFIYLFNPLLTPIWTLLSLCYSWGYAAILC